MISVNKDLIGKMVYTVFPSEKHGIVINKGIVEEYNTKYFLSKNHFTATDEVIENIKVKIKVGDKYFEMNPEEVFEDLTGIGEVIEKLLYKYYKS